MPAALPTLLLLLLPPQDLAARYQGGAVTRTELGIEFARRLRTRTVGQEALQHLIDRELVQQEAAARKLVLSESQIREAFQSLRGEMLKAGRKLEEYLKEKGISEAEFREYVGLLTLQQQMVRTDLGLPAATQVTTEQMALWLKDMRGKRQAKETPELVASGVVAQVGGKSITLTDLGLAVARSVSAEERRRVIQQIVAVQRIEAECKQEGITVDPEEIERELLARRAAIERNPRFAGTTFELILEAQGVKADDIKGGPVLRSQLLLDKLILKRYPDEALRKLYQEKKESYDRRLGPTRRVLQILVRGANQKSRYTMRSFDEAKAECEKLQKKITDARSFELNARIHSEDDAKGRGGDLGLLHRDEPGVDPLLTEQAFTLPLLTLSAPLRSERGWHLVMPVAEFPAPGEPELFEALRRELVGEHLRALVRDARIEYTD